MIGERPGRLRCLTMLPNKPMNRSTVAVQVSRALLALRYLDERCGGHRFDEECGAGRVAVMVQRSFQSSGGLTDHARGARSGLFVYVSFVLLVPARVVSFIPRKSDDQRRDCQNREVAPHAAVRGCRVRCREI